MLNPESAFIASRQRTATTYEALRRYTQLESVGLIQLQVAAGPIGAERARPEPIVFPGRTTSAVRGKSDPTVSTGARPSTP